MPKDYKRTLRLCSHLEVHTSLGHYPIGQFSASVQYRKIKYGSLKSEEKLVWAKAYQTLILNVKQNS